MKNEYIIYLKQLSQETGLTIDKEKGNEINSVVLKYVSYGNIIFILIKPTIILLTILAIVGISIFFKGVSILMMILYVFLSVITAILLGFPRGVINVTNGFYEDILKILSLIFGITRDILTNIRSLTLKRIPKLTDIIKFVLYGYVLPSLESAIHKKVFFMKQKIYNFMEMIIGKITDAIFYAVKQVPAAEDVFDTGAYLEKYSDDIKNDFKLNIDKSAFYVEEAVKGKVKEVVDKNLNVIGRNDRIKKIDTTVSDIQDKIERILNKLIQKKLDVVSKLENESKNIVERVFLPIFKTMKTINWVLITPSIVISLSYLMLLIYL